VTQKRSLEDERELRNSAESRLRETENKVEKDRLMDRVDTLEEGNERFFEMKEKQVGIAICGVTYRISASCENDSSAMFHL